MKTKRALLPIALLAILSLLACESPFGDPSGDPSSNPTDGPLSISGSFKDGDSTVYFKAAEDTSRSLSSSRAVTSVPLSGTLDDGDITFRLKGSYDTESSGYSLSAASSTIRYTISGDAMGGQTKASIATRASASEPFGAPVIVAVIEKEEQEVASQMTSTTEAELVAGLSDTSWQGVWYDEEDPSTKYIVDEWGIKFMVNEQDAWFEAGSMAFSSLEAAGDDTYNIVTDMTTVDWSRTEGISYSVGFRDYPQYLREQGNFVYDENAYPLASYRSNCLVYAAPYYADDTIATMTYFPSIKYSSGYSTVELEGVRCGDYFVSINYNDVYGTGEYMDNPMIGWGTSANPIVITYHEWAKISVGDESSLAQYPEAGTSYATVAEALAAASAAAAEGVIPFVGFDASDFVSLDAEYTAAIKEIKAWTSDPNNDNWKFNEQGEADYQAVVAAAFKDNVAALATLPAENFIVFESMDYNAAFQEWLMGGTAIDWKEEALSDQFNSAIDYTTYYIGAQIAFADGGLTFTMYGDSDMTEADFIGEGFTPKLYKSSFADAQALFSSGRLIPESAYTLTR